MLTIGKLAKATNASIDTLRYYERVGLLKPDTRTANDYRMYEKTAINRVRFIKNAQHLGFSLSEIEKLLFFGTTKGSTAGDVLELAKKKIVEHKNKMKELERIQVVLIGLADKCSGAGPTSECPILKSLYPEPYQTE